MNWMEGNALFSSWTLALEAQPPHAAESLTLAVDTLRRYPVNRVMRR